MKTRRQHKKKTMKIDDNMETTQEQHKKQTIENGDYLRL